MKCKIKHIIVTMVLFIPLLLFAETPAESASGILHKVPTTSNKKRVPARTYIECSYENCMLVFDANFDYEYMEVEVSGAESLSDILTPTQPFIEAPALSGTYTIRCTTDDGAVYEGTITL